MAGVGIIRSFFQYLVITIGLLFFALPIYASTLFAFRDRDGNFTADPIRAAGENEAIMESLSLTMKIAAGTVLLTLAILIPTVAYIHLVIPQSRGWMEFLTLTPLVIPPIVQGVGFLYSMPTSFKATPYALIFAYTILALPFSYRALDSAFTAIDLRTLYDASISLGGSFFTIMKRVLIPNVATGIFGAVFLTIALVLGEFAYASLLLWDTFPTVLAVAGMSGATTAVALSVLSLLGVWLVLTFFTIFNQKKTSTMVGVK
jgi:putative spermidine/putrescine transport system permease protein